MNIIYQSVKFREEDVVKIYTRGYSNGEVKVIEVNDKNKTIREWWCLKEDCPYDSHVAYDTVRMIRGGSSDDRDIRIRFKPCWTTRKRCGASCA